MQNIQNLQRICKTLSGGWPYSWLQASYAYGFDGTDDYISWATIGKNSYDLVVAGNVFTGNDAFGDYINFVGNRDWGAVTGTLANIGTTSGINPQFTQATSFSIKVRVQVTSLPAGWWSGLYGSSNDACIWTNAAWNINFTIRGSSTVTYTLPLLSINTLYDLYMTYDSATAKFYCYVDWVLQNVGGTSWPATFTTDWWIVWDSAVWSGSFYSCSKAVYHACTWNVTLNQSEITADIALWNNAKSDTRIVQYYTPANLAYNTQYLSNPKDLSNATWTKGTGTSVVANFSTDPSWGSEADQVTWTGVDVATSKVQRTFTTLSGTIMASRTFVVKAFVRVAAATATFRLECSQNGVATNYSSDLTATTVWQEFTFTQTFSSSTSGTGISAGLVTSAVASAAILEVWNVRIFVSNESCWDEAPNIWGAIGRRTPVVLSAWTKIGSDSSSAADVNSILLVPWFYFHQRNSTNEFIARCDTTLSAIQVNAWVLWNWFRWKAHIVAYKYFVWTKCTLKIYLNWALIQTFSLSYTDRPPTTQYGTVPWAWRKWSNYYTGNSRDLRCYIPNSWADSDAALIYAGSEPVDATKVFNWKPLVGENWVSAVDRSGNSRVGTLNNGVTRVMV